MVVHFAQSIVHFAQGVVHFLRLFIPFLLKNSNYTVLFSMTCARHNEGAESILLRVIPELDSGIHAFLLL